MKRNKKYDMGSPECGFMIMFTIPIFVIILSPLFLILVAKEVPVNNTLAIQQEFQEEKLNISHKMNIAGGLFQQTSTDISFLIKDNEQIVSKNLQYKGNIKYIPGNKNSITYTEYTLFGNSMGADNIIITYDKELFSIQ